MPSSGCAFELQVTKGFVKLVMDELDLMWDQEVLARLQSTFLLLIVIQDSMPLLDFERHTLQTNFSPVHLLMNNDGVIMNGEPKVC